MLKGPKRSFVVVFLLGGEELWGNFFPNGTKNMREQKFFQIEQKNFANKRFGKGKQKMLVVEQKIVSKWIFKLLWNCISFNELFWPNERKVLSSEANYWNCGIELPRLTWMALCGLASYSLVVFTAINMCGLVWSCMASLWPYMVFYGRISSLLAVIDPNSFGLVWLNL